ncbi:DUF4129 domain-containing protein [Mycobacterium sp. 29Ha]|uniref:DUF4129 domain-containing protein n=1 Tax=Mycobacterium sp. 29Ha TaxID=2939268 RepID=UPI002938E5C2|nr:DUF4129 domain-containing protein [Mycobacterium sp. 29Ha]MDV3133433.1 DUF4129 domain-containing protein [Mycobacterium sp. 29Ha]
MTGIDRSTQRVIAVIALMIVAAVALRGYIPGGGEPISERERPPSNPAALIVVIVMVCAAVAIIGFAIIARLRDRTPRPAARGDLPQASRTRGLPSLRFTLIVTGLVLGWLLLVLLLTRLGGPPEPASDAPTAQETSTQAPDTTARPAPADDAAEPDTNVIGYLIPPMLILMVLVVVGTAVVSKRQRSSAVQYLGDDDIPAAAEAPAAGASLVRAAEVGLAEIGDRTREPREAIIACYAAMERELTRVPGAVPQDCDTPSEVLARAVHNRALRADSATELVELFEEARFSPHVMTEEHRDAAVSVLERVLAELPDGAARSSA